MEFIAKFALASRGPRTNTVNLIVDEAWVDYADGLSDIGDGPDGDAAATAGAGAVPQARTYGGDVTSS
jgi:hypothetical protein